MKKWWLFVQTDLRKYTIDLTGSGTKDISETLIGNKLLSGVKQFYVLGT
jgi:hypothetical protein